MIANLLNSISKAWIKAEQAREEDKREEIVNYIIRDIINEGCGLRIGSIIDYNPNQRNLENILKLVKNLFLNEKLV